MPSLGRWCALPLDGHFAWHRLGIAVALVSGGRLYLGFRIEKISTEAIFRGFRVSNIKMNHVMQGRVISY